MKEPIYGGNSLKEFILLQVLKEEAHKQLSYYRQKQDDLVARMATEWPSWGCTLDFYSHMVLPLLKNSFILNFMNRSEGFGLNEVDLKFGYVKAGTLRFVDEEFQLPAEGRSSGTERVHIKADLVDFCLSLLTGITDVKIRKGSKGLPISEALTNWRIEFKGRDPLLVRIRDADIGAQSFFALLEGIMRNASKHGLCPTPGLVEQAGSNSREKPFAVHIVFCREWKELQQFIEVNFKKDADADDYSYIMISVSRDLLVDTVTSAERKIGDISLVEFLRKQFNEGIIDSKGKVSPGNWGIKEMKTCAAFLGGESLYAVNDREPRFIRVTITKGNEIWPDGLTRICYVVRVEKPRLALALVPEHKRPAEPWEGVRFVTDLEEFSRKVDYDFLYIDQERKEEYKDLRGRSLPQRVVRGDFFGKDTRSSSKARRDEPELSKEERLSYRLYEDVLSQYLCTLGEKGRQFRLLLYFDSNERATTWEKNIKREWRLKDGRTITIDFLKSADLAPEPKFNLNDNYYQASIFRHSLLSGVVGKAVPGQQLDNSFYPYYAQQVSGSDPFFSFLLSLEPADNKPLAGLVMRQIAEASLLNILIIDERIAQSLSELKAKDDAKILLAHKLRWMGIHVAGSLKLSGDRVPIWQTDQPNELLAEIVFDEEGYITNKVSHGLPIHILLIHATRLNGIFDRLRDKGIVKNKEQLMARFREFDRTEKDGEFDRTVIVHSGRGKTEGDIPESAPFLEYSTVEKYVLNEPSKFYLVQIVRNVKGDKK
jgi:hypothetical protein